MLWSKWQYSGDHVSPGSSGMVDGIREREIVPPIQIRSGFPVPISMLHEIS